MLVEFDTPNLCDDPLLNETYLKVYVREKVNWDSNRSSWKLKILNKIYLFFAQNNFGLDDEKAKAEEWVGVIDISFGDKIIIYGKIDEPDGIY